MEYDYVIPGVVLSVVLGIGVFLWYLRRNDDYWEKRGVPYAPRQIIYGLLVLYKKPISEILMDAYKKHGRMHGSFEFRKPSLTVCEPDLLRDILVKDFHVFHSRRDMTFADDMISKMVSALNGEDWKRVRTIITPAFTSKRMRQISHIINESSQSVLETFGKYADRGEPVDCKRIFGAFSMDVIASSAFATKIDSHNDPDNPFVKRVRESFLQQSPLQIVLFLILPFWIVKKFRLGGLKTMDFFKDVILQVIKKRKETGKRYDDMLQLLMDAQDEFAKENPKEARKNIAQEDESDQYGSVVSNGITYQQKYKKLSEDELVAQCVLFFIVGYETTASTLAFMAYSLALHPEYQEKLIKEVDDAFEKHKEMSYDVIRDMKYLDCVLSETLRMYPIAVRGERTACEDYKLGNTGIVIEKGMIVGFNIHAMHHDPELFPDPEKFDPERFSSGNMNHHPYAYLPFGAGPRNCLGMRFAIMEIKMCISNILRFYRIKNAPTTKVPLEYTKGQILLSVKELPLIVEKRNN